MTLNDLLDNIQSIQGHAEASLAFSLNGTTFDRGYHVTELKLADVTGVDCSGRLSNWSEASLQVLDGDGPMKMPCGKFLGILNKSRAIIDRLGDADLHVEFSPGNAGLQRFEIAQVETNQGQITVKLSPTQALCKPSQAFESSC